MMGRGLGLLAGLLLAGSFGGRCAEAQETTSGVEAISVPSERTGAGGGTGQSRQQGGLPGSMATLRNYKSARVSSEDRPGNTDMRRIEPGKTFVMADLTGPGEITHLWTTIATRDPQHLRNIVLRIYWDGNEFPSVESPIGDFYGLGNNQYYIFSNPMQAIGTDKGMNAFWPMPFAKSARVEVTNEGKVGVDAFYYYVDWRKFEQLPRGLGYFHAQYRQAHPAPEKQNYLILNTAGAPGHFAGVSLSVHTQVGGWWGEGDDIFTVDGEESPSLWGTGSEDYFCGAWCYGETFYNDYFGMPLRSRLDQGANNFWNVYRLHLEAPITFTKSLKVEIEHGAGGFDNTRGGKNNNYSSVAYWYAAQPLKLEGTLPPAAERISEFSPPNQEPGVFEAQYMELKAPFGVAVDHQDMGGWSKEGRAWRNKDQLWAREAKKGSVTELTFETTAPLAGVLELGLTKAPDYGKIKVELDETTVLGEFNGYDTVVRPAVVDAGKIELKPGKHKLRITNLEKSPEAKNTLWGLDYVRVK